MPHLVSPQSYSETLKKDTEDKQAEAAKCSTQVKALQVGCGPLCGPHGKALLANVRDAKHQASTGFAHRPNYHLQPPGMPGAHLAPVAFSQAQSDAAKQDAEAKQAEVAKLSAQVKTLEVGGRDVGCRPSCLCTVVAAGARGRRRRK